MSQSKPEFQAPIPCRTREHHYDFYPSYYKIYVYAIKPDHTGTHVVKTRCLLKLDFKDLKGRPDLENLWYQCFRAWFPHWWTTGPGGNQNTQAYPGGGY